MSAAPFPVQQAVAAVMPSCSTDTEIINDALHGSPCKETETSSTQSDTRCLGEVTVTSQAQFLTDDDSLGKLLLLPFLSPLLPPNFHWVR